MSSVTLNGSGMVYSDGLGNTIVNNGRVVSEKSHSELKYNIRVNSYISQSGFSIASDNGRNMMHQSSLKVTSIANGPENGDYSSSLTFPRGASAECKEKLRAVIPTVLEAASKLSRSNDTAKEIGAGMDKSIREYHQSAAKFCASKDQYQQGKQEVREQLNKADSAAAASSLPTSSYTPKDLTTYRFPKANYLGACLEKDSLTSKEQFPYLHEKGIIPKITEKFAEQVKKSQGIESDVMSTMGILNQKLRLDPISVGIISMNVIEALKACSQEETPKTSK